LPRNWQACNFCRQKDDRLHRNEWLGWQGANTTITNMYFLGGAGLGLDYARPEISQFACLRQARSELIQGRNLSDYDADNKNAHTHAWIQVIKFL